MMRKSEAGDALAQSHIVLAWRRSLSQGQSKLILRTDQPATQLPYLEPGGPGRRNESAANEDSIGRSAAAQVEDGAGRKLFSEVQSQQIMAAASSTSKNRFGESSKACTRYAPRKSARKFASAPPRASRS